MRVITAASKRGLRHSHGSCVGRMSGLVNGETLNVTGDATFNSKNVADANLVTINSISLADGTHGGLAGNYTLASGQAVTSYIAPKALTISGQVAQDKAYDGTTTATLTGGSLVGVVAGESVMLNPAGTFATANAGHAIAVTAADSLSGAAATNYTVTQPTGLVANITALVEPEIPPVVTAPAAYEGALGHVASNVQATPVSDAAALYRAPAVNHSSSVGSMTNDLAGLNLTVVDREVSLPSEPLQDTSDDDK